MLLVGRIREILSPLTPPEALDNNLLRETLHEMRRGYGIDSDNAVLAALGYKQEFKRAFTPFETLSLSFTTIGLFPSVAYVSHLLLLGHHCDCCSDSVLQC